MHSKLSTGTLLSWRVCRGRRNCLLQTQQSDQPASSLAESFSPSLRAAPRCASVDISTSAGRLVVVLELIRSAVINILISVQLILSAIDGSPDERVNPDTSCIHFSASARC
jgi:hypothetical protein